MNDITLAGERIVVGIDGSKSALAAALWAALEAQHRNLPLHLVHAIAAPPVPSAAETPSEAEFLEVVAVDVEEWLTAARTAIHALCPTVEVTAERIVRDPVSALVERSDRAHLLVLGSRGLGGFTGMLIGSTAVAVVSHGRCPVAVVRGNTLATGPVVVGVDGSPTSEHALALAYAEASLRGAELIAVHAFSDIPAQSYPGMLRTFEQWDDEQIKQEQVLAERVAGYGETYPDVVVTRVVVKDQPVRNLLEQAISAQLLVVGSRGRGAFTGTVLGSTSQALIYHAPCPTIVVRAAAAV